MLTFLRKHQRIFFIFITVVIVLSFSFFGTFSAFSQKEAIPDKVLGKAVDGSAITKRGVDGMIRLFSFAVEDRSSWQKGGMPNLFNDAVLQKELFITGMGSMLAERYFDQIKPDLEERLKKVKNFRPYVHPQSNFISAESVWQRIFPVMGQDFAAIKLQSDVCTPETFALLSKLYLDQLYFPPDLLKKFLVNMENQNSNIAPDPALFHHELNLFGFQSLEDWFGPKYVELCAQFFLNVAAIAEQKGYSVSKAEARADLFHNVYNGMKAISQDGKISSKELDHYYRSEMQSIGLDEDTTLQLWGKVMLFRRLFQDVGNSVFLDPLAYQQFQTFTKECATVDLYELPEALRFRSFRNMLQFQVYLDALSSVGKQRQTLLSLPSALFSIDEIERRAPEFVESRFEIELAETSKDDLAQQVTLKQTWEWQLDEQNWEVLWREFPVLAPKKVATREEKLAVLDKLDSKMRLKIDEFSRRKIADVHPEWIEQQLAIVQPRTMEISLRSKGGRLPLQGISDGRAFLTLLQKAPLKEEAQESNPYQQQLNQFTGDGNHYYRIQLIKRGPQHHVMTFQEALADGTLDSVLDKRLEDAYVDVRRKEPTIFQNGDGSWKSFAQVKDLIGRYAFSDLIRSIEESVKTNGGSVPKQPSLEFYADRRFLSYMRQAKEALELNPENGDWVLAESDAANMSLEKQWRLLKTHRSIERGSSMGFSKEELFKLPMSGWSSVQVGKAGELAFFQLLGRGKGEEMVAKEVNQGHEMLSLDARRCLMAQVLNTISEKKGIALSRDVGEE